MNPIQATTLVTVISCRWIDNLFIHAELRIESEGVTRSCIVQGEMYRGLPLFIEDIRWTDGDGQFDRFDLCDQINDAIQNCLPN